MIDPSAQTDERSDAAVTDAPSAASSDANDAHDGPPDPDAVSEGAPVQLLEARFSRDWRKHPCAKHADAAMRGCRVVGVVSARVHGTKRQGLLLRHIKSKTYRLAGNFPPLDLPTEPTDHFLEGLRLGHHGGPGRCQGRPSADGRSYPKRCRVSLTTDTMRALSLAGDGNASLGLRRLADRVRSRVTEAFGRVAALESLADAYVAPSVSSRENTLYAVTVFLSRSQLDFLRTLGGGAVTAGVRACVWVDAQDAVASDA